MAITANAAKPFAVISNILLHSAIKYKYWSTPTLYPNQAYSLPQCHRTSITPMSIKILINIHTQFYASVIVFSQTRKDSKMLWSCTQNYWKLIFSQIHDSGNFFLNATPKHFKFPILIKYQAMHQLCHDILSCDIPVVSLQYTAKAKIKPIKTQFQYSSYKWQLHVSATQQTLSDSLYEKRKIHMCSLYIT